MNGHLTSNVAGPRDRGLRRWAAPQVNENLYAKVGALLAWVFFGEVLAVVAVLLVLLARSLL